MPTESSRILLSQIGPFPAGGALTAVGNPAGDMLYTAVRESAPGGARVGVWLVTKAGAATLVAETDLPGKDNSGGAIADEAGTVYLISIEADAPPASGTTQKPYLYVFPKAIPPFTRAGSVGAVDQHTLDRITLLEQTLARLAQALKGGAA